MRDDRIDKFIPTAMKIAKERVKEFGKERKDKMGMGGRVYSHCYRTQFFHQEMNRITKEAGLRV